MRDPIVVSRLGGVNHIQDQSPKWSLRRRADVLNQESPGSARIVVAGPLLLDIRKEIARHAEEAVRFMDHQVVIRSREMQLIVVLVLRSRRRSTAASSPIPPVAGPQDVRRSQQR